MLRRENEELKYQVEWLSRQLFGRVMPKLLTLLDFELDDDNGEHPETPVADLLIALNQPGPPPPPDTLFPR